MQESDINKEEEEGDGTPLVSVIVPVYNVLPYLREALDSVVNQTYRNLEIIVIDDGSTDSSGDVCDEYATQDKRVTVVHQENRGLSAARNVGLDIMSGSIIAYLDPDDAYIPTFIEELLTSLTDERADIAICRGTAHRTTGSIVTASPSRPAPTATAGTYGRVNSLRLLADGAINVGKWNKLYRREVWENIRFPEGRNYEDVATTYKVLDSCRMTTVIDRTLYLHRNRPNSITASHTWKNENDRLRATEDFLSFVQRHVPEVYTTEQLQRVRRTHFTSMIIIYARYAGAKEIDGKYRAEEL